MDCPLLRNNECHCPFIHSFSHPTHLYWLKNSIYQALCKHWACEKKHAKTPCTPSVMSTPRSGCYSFQQTRYGQWERKSRTQNILTIVNVSQKNGHKISVYRGSRKTFWSHRKKKFVKEVMCAFLFLGLLFGISSQPPYPNPTPQDDSIFMCLSHEGGGWLSPELPHFLQPRKSLPNS